MYCYGCSIFRSVKVAIVVAIVQSNACFGGGGGGELVIEGVKNDEVIVLVAHLCDQENVATKEQVSFRRVCEVRLGFVDHTLLDEDTMML